MKKLAKLKILAHF